MRAGRCSPSITSAGGRHAARQVAARLSRHRRKRSPPSAAVVPPYAYAPCVREDPEKSSLPSADHGIIGISAASFGMIGTKQGVIRRGTDGRLRRCMHSHILSVHRHRLHLGQIDGREAIARHHPRSFVQSVPSNHAPSGRPAGILEPRQQIQPTDS